jgi:hypothetical protein
MVNAIFKAKLFIESLYLEHKNPKWFYTKPLDSYNDERDRVEFYVLEGEPPRGFIIANYNLGTVYGFNMQLEPVTTTCVAV